MREEREGESMKGRAYCVGGPEGNRDRGIVGERGQTEVGVGWGGGRERVYCVEGPCGDVQP